MAFIQQKDQFKVWFFAVSGNQMIPSSKAIMTIHKVSMSIRVCSMSWSASGSECHYQQLKRRLLVKRMIQPNKILFSILCDGDEINNVPGVSVINELKAQNVVFTGSEVYFYEITTSAGPHEAGMFDTHGVSTPVWKSPPALIKVLPKRLVLL